MRVRDIAEIIEAWAPRDIAWEKDNVGLQIGENEGKVQKIMVAMEISPEVVSDAKRKGIDLIVTHHPLFFHPMRSITTSEGTGKISYELIKSNIAVYAAHTNLDFTRGGVSFALAERLGLSTIDFLHRTTGEMRKITVFVPSDFVDPVVAAMARAGAGIIGDYELCSFRVDGTGTFRARKGAKPFVGSVGTLERVPEVRLEMLAPGWRIPAVLSEMLKTHPYEEVAYDIYPLDNRPGDFGAGAIGNLATEVSLRTFLGRVRNKLTAAHLRFTGEMGSRIKKVAVCGGSGASLLSAAIEAGADAFVTADVKYHTFHDAKGKIALIDAGHYETERPALDVLVNRLRKAITEKGETVKVILTSAVTNPINYQ